MTANLTTVGSLSVGDQIIDRDGLTLRVTAVRPASKRFVWLTVEYVEAGMMACRPVATERKVSVNSMVEVAAG